MTIRVVVFAHNEERRIAACLDSLPLHSDGIATTVVVNGSSDRTADTVRSYEKHGVELVDYPEGGKARSWNRYMLDEAPHADTYVFVDGDAELLPGTVEALAGRLAGNPAANAASGMPRNGRRAAYYRHLLEQEHGLFGDCYALTGVFVSRMRARGIRLPKDLVGDDSLIAALANNDLGPDRERRDDAVVPCGEGGFLCEPPAPTPAGIRLQARRMVNYSVRHFQNRIIRSYMQGEGPQLIPDRLARVYAQWLPQFRARRSPVWFAFDLMALAHMRKAAL